MPREFSTRYDKTCSVCEEPFVARSINATFCSVRCKGWNHRRPGVKPPATRPKRRDCEACGADMTGRHGNARFCDDACWRRFHIPPAQPVDITIPLSCEVCSAEFYRKSPLGLTPKFCTTRCEQWRRRNPEATWDAARTCDWCGVNIAHMKSNARYCSPMHGSALKGHERRVRLRNLPHEPVSKWKVFERDGWRCHLCMKRINKRLRHPHPMSASLDHIIPISDPESPGHVLTNVAASHLTCNVKKNARSAGDQLLLVG